MGFSSTRTNRWPIVIAALALLLLALPASLVWAAPQNRNLFGQEQFTRTSGATNIFQRTFTIPAYVSGPYQLHIINGDPSSGSDRVGIEDAVSAGRVLVDGIEVVVPNEFSHAVATLDKPLALAAGSHTLEIQLASAPESFIRLTISGVIALGDLTQARAGHAGTLLPDGTVLVTGGTGVSGVLSSAERYDPVTLHATALTSPLSTPRSEHSGTLLPQTDSLLIAGHDNLGVLFSIELFRLSDQTFQALTPPVQVLRSGHAATGLLEGRILITGGQSSGALSSAEEFNAQTVILFKPAFDPETGTFTVLANGLHTARWDHTATLLPDGRVLLTGGRNETGFLNSAELFDPVTETFTLLTATLTTPRAGHAATLLPDGRVLLLGGEHASGVLATAEVWTPATGTFTALTQSLLTPRANHTATLLPYGEVLITGGQTTGGTILATTEFYGPPAVDALAPIVHDVSPPTGALGVDLTQIVGVRFSEPVDVRTLTATSMTLSGGASAVPATISPGESGLMVFLVPTAPLAAGTTYTLSLTAAIKDTAGNALAAFTSSFTTVAAPTITNFTPTSGTPGTVVTISGTNFDPVVSKNEVRFNGVLALVTAASATSLMTTVPSGATTGPITVTTRGGTATSGSNFTVITALPPTISGFSPAAGHLGSLVTVIGTNFDPAPSGNQVRLGGVLVTVQSATSTQLVVSVPTGVASGLVAVTTAGGSAQSASAFTVIAMTALSVTPGQATLPVGSGHAFRGTATFTDQTSSDVTSLMSWVSSTPASATVTAAGVAQGVAVGTATITGSLGTFSATGAVQVIAATPGGPPLPPDPSSVAPTLDRTVATTLGAATAFLYTSANPIQTGVAAGTIQPLRAAVIRGIVRTRDGFPLPGVTITVLGHPEFGQTVTRPDGRFDFAVNGGGPLTLTYSKATFLPAQRQVSVPWQDYAVAPDVVLIAYDPQVTTIDLTLPTLQVARGSVMTDADGTRQATLLFPPGTTATMTLPSGGTQPLTMLQVRATEATVGPTGPQAMPAELPATSGYTYAVAYTVDEAVAAGATTVHFSQPVISYVDNWLTFPVGTVVPSGFYDPARGVWVPSLNGQVVKMLSVSGGLAALDTDGDGTADGAAALAALGITDAERLQLASLYQPGQSFWRVPVAHFSSWDSNWGFGPPPEAVTARVRKRPPLRGQPDCQPSSIIRCQTQALAESVALAGTPYRLQYQSDRVRGYGAGYQATLPLSGASLPASLKRIDVEVLVAGQRFFQSFPATPNQSTTVTWDGQDAYGRPVQGRQLVTARIGYVYDGVYQQTARFGYTGNGTAITGDPTRRQVTLWEELHETIGAWDATAQRLGGWQLTVHHAYDPLDRTLYLGDGTTRSASAMSPVILTVAGNGGGGSTGNGGPAIQAELGDPSGVALAADGSLYIAHLCQVRKVEVSGSIALVAGGTACGFSGDGGPATAAQLNGAVALALASDGSLYIADRGNQRIRRVDAAGIITTVAGDGTLGSGGDGGPATAAQLFVPTGVAVAPDGSVYLADGFDVGRLRRVGTDGTITTVVSGLGSLRGIAAGPEGSLYVLEASNRLRRVGPDGTLTTVAGTGNPAGGFSGDGEPATAALLNAPTGVAVGPDGSLFIADAVNKRVRQVGLDGIIRTAVGTGTSGFGGDGGPALAALVSLSFGGDPTGLAVAPDFSFYLCDRFNHRVRRVAPPFQGVSLGEIAIPAEDGSEVYVFTQAGRHLRTLDALTGALRTQFTYTGSGLLTAVTDADGQVTTIERDGGGNPTAVVAPGGQRTTLTIYGDGSLASITNPANETTALTYATDGLLATLQDPRVNTHRYTYDALGRLSRDEDAATGFKALARTEQATGWTVAVSTALNRTTTYQVENLAIGDQRRTVTEPTGLLTTTLSQANGTTTLTAPEGTLTTTVEGADPRWGMQAPLLKTLTVQTPGGLTSTLSTTRGVSLSNLADPFSLTSQTDTLVINGRTYTSTYTQATRLLTTTTPASRTSNVTLDAKGRVTQEQVTGLEPVAYTYDSLGRLSTITQGTGVDARTSSLAYNSKNELVSLTDPLNRTVGFAYDLAGRITTQTLPDTRQISYSYDANGNVTAITPPGKPAHTFAYTPVDLESQYSPPSPLAGEGGGEGFRTLYTYNLDRQLTLVTRPDSQTLQLGYEPTGGRLSTLTLPGSQVLTYAYHPTTGNLSTITAPGDSTLSYSYDGSLLTNTAWSGTVAGSVGRTYDNNFRITSQSVNGGNTIGFGYDTDSLLTSAGSLSIARSAQHGLITGTTLASVTDSRSYNPFGELSTYTANVSGSPVFSVQYTRDKLGRITQKVETLGGVTDTFDYTYDLAGRLKEVQKNGTVTATYLYDSNGNRLSRTTPSGTILGFYDAQDRLTQYGTTTSAYTANGELQSSTVGGQTTTYQYDVLGNLKSVVGPTGTTIEYVVDGQNRRIGKKVNGVLVQGWLYQNQLNAVAELDGAGNVVSRFVYGTKANVPDYLVKSGITYRIVSDHLGSPRLVINTTDGTIVQRMDYDEFGNIATDTNPGFQPFGFASGLSDQHTGLVRFGARDYDAVTGRWTAKDPILFYGQDTNLFAYLDSDPINGTDPLGLQPIGPPPVPVPGGKPIAKWKWNPDPQNRRGGTWGPQEPIPGQSQPSASRDPAGHWDVDDGKGNRQRYSDQGKPISAEEAHGRSPRTLPGTPAPIPPLGGGLVCPVPLILPPLLEDAIREAISGGGIS